MEPRDRVASAISPELVLVDPELAARARAALLDHPWPPVPRITVEQVAATRVGPRKSFATGFLALGLAAASVVVGLSVLPTPNRPTFAASGGETVVRPQQQPPPVTRPRLPKSTRDATIIRPRPPRRTRPAPATTQETQSLPQRARSAPRSTPKQSRARSKRRIAPRRQPPTVRITRGASFFWPPRAGVRSYHARFLRNGKTLYQAHSRVPHLRLPTRIRFTPGVYRWIVRPVIGSGLRVRLGSPVLDATFRVDGD